MRRRTLGILAGTVLVAGIVAWRVIDRAVDRDYRRVLAWASAEQTRLEARPGTRPVLWGGARQGAAFDAYRKATDRVSRHRELAERITEELRLPDADPAARAGAFDALGAALDDLREGAHRADARKTIDWGSWSAASTVRLLSCRALTNLAQMRVRMLVAEQPVEAVRVLLDSVQFGRDLMQSPLMIDRMVGAAVVGIVLMQTADGATLDRLDDRALSTLARGLEILDDNLPLAVDAVHAETVSMVREFEKGRPGFDLDPGLRYAFSERWLLADVVPRLVELGGRRDRAAVLPWPEARQLLRGVRKDITGHPVLSRVVPPLDAPARTRRHALTLLRLLRIDVAERLGKTLELEDPLGDGPLRRVEEDGERFCRSAGERLGEPLQRALPH